MNTQQDKSTNRLSELWFARNALNQSEWGELYQLIWDVLIVYNATELNPLSLDKEDYIQQFYIEKVFRSSNSDKAGTIHPGFIRYCYRKFLIDQLRSAVEKRYKNIRCFSLSSLARFKL